MRYAGRRIRGQVFWDPIAACGAECLTVMLSRMRFTFTLDSTDPERLATFWAAALGFTSIGEFGVFWPLASADDGEPPLVIQRVSEPKIGKNRMHLDVHVADLSADPDGNEFCVVQRPA